MKPWQIYEEAARKVISDLRSIFGIIGVGAKQNLPGIDGNTYELDAVAWTDESGNFLLIEAKRHTRSGLSQDTINSIVTKLFKVGAEGAIVVTPLPLQSGAKRDADYDHVFHITLTSDSTVEDYLAEYMGKRFLGASISEHLIASDKCEAKVIKGKLD